MVADVLYPVAVLGLPAEYSLSPGAQGSTSTGSVGPVPTTVIMTKWCQ